jgi:hypothetical protein
MNQIERINDGAKHVFDSQMDSGGGGGGGGSTCDAKKI